MSELNIKQLRLYDLGGIFVPVYNEEFEQLVNIAETTKKFISARQAVYSKASTFEDFDHMQKLEAELTNLIKNVEIEVELGL